MSFLKYQKENPEFLNNYLKYKRYIEFCAETSVDEAYFDLRTLFRYIKLSLYHTEKLKDITIAEFKEVTIKEITINDLGKITQFSIDKYIVFLSNTLNNDVSTRNRKIASAKKLFEYLEINNHITFNPTKWTEYGRVKDRLPVYLNLEESKKLLAASINSECQNKIRNYAITCIFLNCSLRLSELVLIDLTDIKIDNSEQTIKINGKGNKQRLLYLNEAVCEAIKLYLEVRPKLSKENPDYNALFLSNRNKRISNRMVQTIIKEELKAVFEEEYKKYHTHSLRHSSASLLYNENDIDIFVLKEILGHASIEATEIYTHVSNEKLKRIMENFAVSSILEKMEVSKNERT